MIFLLAGIIPLGLLYFFWRKLSRSQAKVLSVIYFIITTFTIVGNPFATISTPNIPIFGIMLTMPWSLVVGVLYHPTMVGNGLNYPVIFALEVCAILNAIILFFIFAKKQEDVNV